MHNANKLKIGLFGANCSSGRAVTLVPERWSGNWPDNRKLAAMADEAGIDFLLPIGRWKGYGGETDYQGATLETITWATGLLALTKRVTVFGTVHAPLFNPVIAASLRLSGQFPDQRSGTRVTARPDEQLAPNRPILSLFALCIDMRSCADGAGASTILLPRVLFDTAGTVRLAHGRRVLNGSARY